MIPYYPTSAARGYADEGYEWAVQLDLSKYFDTQNHEKLLNLLRETIKDERVVQLIKKFRQSGEIGRAHV